MKARAPFQRSADHDADRRQFVLGLDDGIARLAGGSVGPVLAAIAREGFGQRRRWRDRIPGRDRCAAIDGTQRRGAVAVDEDAVAHLVGAAQLEADRRQVRLGVVAAHVQRVAGSA